ncbi:MAG TPA: hypothetical protein VFN73_09855 [Propionibacteriaceae bacterium]|nr:hypothetical protein [Propionibacteriaceae bacterium]
MKRRGDTLWLVALYAVAMAYLESAVVVYLRRIYGITDLTTSLTRFDPQISAIEVGREAATLVMLVAVGWLAGGRSRQSRIGHLFVAFGVWDIFYYVWLHVFIGWPASLLAPDLLFLIPAPWWGPVLAPSLIALLMVVGGVRAVQLADRGVRARASAGTIALLAVGCVLMLVAFLWDALRILPADAAQLAAVKPTPFLWPLYLAGLAAAVASVWRMTFPGALDRADAAPLAPVQPASGSLLPIDE